ncbi:MAG: MraY family glycosyltransferase [Candidatus Omnitrophota bacterium]
MRILLVFFTCLFVSLILTPLLRKLSFVFRLLDHPNGRKIHLKPTPLLGGLAISIPVLSVIFLLKNTIDSQMMSIFFASLIIVILGLIDDKIKLSAKLRLFTQLLVVVILIINSLTLTIFPDNALGLTLRFFFTVIWVVGIINSVNFIDGLNGLCVGLAFISSLMFAIIAYFSRQNQILILSLALCGACLGFLPFNLSGKIFLGESGSTFLGFLLATLAIMGVWAEDNFVGVCIPVLILGVPIFDMILTTIMRIKEKKVASIKEWLEYTGKDHFHHRLVDLGLSPGGAVIFIYLVNICLGISAMALLRATWKIAILLIIQAASIFAMIGVLMVVASRRQSGWGK